MAAEEYSPTLPKLNHLQMKGTHNSYHLATPILAWTQLGYTHAPIKEQLENQGVRQMEFDVHQCRDNDVCVYHIGLVDTRTHCDTLKECLTEVKEWSSRNRSHHPIFIFLEPKDSPQYSKEWQFFQNIEDQILSVFSKDDILTPDNVRGKHFTLKKAIETNGWPAINAVRGKVVFVLLDLGGHRDNYTLDAPALQKRLMFTTSNPHREDAAIMMLDDPIAHKDRIRDLAERGFIVRTRADEGLYEPSANDFSRLSAALDSGAHMISTDIPVKLDSYDYWFDLKGGTPSRCNPVSAHQSCRERDL